jgi:crossover junction endodeoxyribonuclease RuvC
MIADKTILGIDPGTNVMGYGVIETACNKVQLVNLGIVTLGKFPDHHQKLGHIFKRTLSLIEQYKPDEMAIEAPFYGKNVQSMLKLGRAQGVTIAAALYRSVPIFEYAPRKIKMSITGQGNATKEQVAWMLASILQLKTINEKHDATDGLAAAICHFFQGKKDNQSGGGSWKEFIRKNPGKVK